MKFFSHSMFRPASALLLLLLLGGAGCGTGRALLGDVQDTFPPQAEISVTPTSVSEGDSVTFYLDAAIKAPSASLDFAWDFDTAHRLQNVTSEKNPKITIDPLLVEQATTAHCSVLITHSLGAQLEQVTYTFDVTVNPRNEPVLPAELQLSPQEAGSGQTVVFKTNLIEPTDVTVLYQWDFGKASPTSIYYGASPSVALNKLTRTINYDPDAAESVNTTASEVYQVTLTVTYVQGSYVVHQVYNNDKFKLTVKSPSPGLQLKAISPTHVRGSSTAATDFTFSYLLASGDATKRLWDFGALGNAVADDKGNCKVTLIAATPVGPYHGKLTLENDFEILECSFTVHVDQ
jgi:hypothetical protein